MVTRTHYDVELIRTFSKENKYIKIEYLFSVKAQLSSAIWLLFLDTNTSLDQFFTDINIPFDCQFLVAQPHGDHVVVLTEVYRVSPTLPLQIHRFGNWTAGGGLTWPSQGLYRRRNNLKGHIIRATHVNVCRNPIDMRKI
jgi:hypothetical protein